VARGSVEDIVRIPPLAAGAGVVGCAGTGECGIRFLGLDEFLNLALRGAPNLVSIRGNSVFAKREGCHAPTSLDCEIRGGFPGDSEAGCLRRTFCVLPNEMLLETKLVKRLGTAPQPRENKPWKKAKQTSCPSRRTAGSSASPQGRRWTFLIPQSTKILRLIGFAAQPNSSLLMPSALRGFPWAEKQSAPFSGPASGPSRTAPYIGTLARLALAAIFLMQCHAFSWSQTQEHPAGTATGASGPSAMVRSDLETVLPPESAAQLEGLPVRKILFEGIDASQLGSLPGTLAQVAGKPLTRRALRESLWQLFSTGLYNTLEAECRRDGGQVDLIFRGAPRPFIGTVGVYGAKGATVNTQLESAAQLSPGTRFTQAKMDRAVQQMRAALAQDGYYEPVITPTVSKHPADRLVDLVFRVESGTQARIGSVQVTGDPGMSTAEFR